MVDLPIGTRFLYEDRPCEVVEAQSDGCEECVLGYYECLVFRCEPVARQDGKKVCFKWI